MKLGIGGGFLGVRGGISTKGIGAGVGPLSAGTSWKGLGGGGDGGGIGWLIIAAILFCAVAWPYFLGTFIAVKFGAENPSTGRLVVGICFQTVFLASVVAYFMSLRGARADRVADEALRAKGLVSSGTISRVNHGRSVSYRHDNCKVKHRSSEAAARCRKPAGPAGVSMRATEVAGARVPANHRLANRLAAGWGGAVLAVGFVAALIVLITDPIVSPSELAAPGACPTQTSVGGEDFAIEVPDLDGRQADEAEERLQGLGLKNVDFTSINPHYESVWNASNWTVVSTDPGAGCVLRSPYTPVKLKVTKP